MNYFVGFVIGFVVAWFVLRFVMKTNRNACSKDKPEVRKQRIVTYLKRYDEITNDIYEEMTGISNAQAERDLDALEKEGILVQIGKTGRSVKYKLKS